MLKLIRCEFWKLKRNKLIRAAALVSVIFPVIFSVLLRDGTLEDLASTSRKESGFLILIPLSVILSAYLFFNEHDNGTLKNLLCIPVSRRNLAFAKTGILLLFSLAYETVEFLTCLVLSIIKGASVIGWALQLRLALAAGVLLWAVALPCIILVIWCNKSYIISVIITFFYTLSGYALHVSSAVMMKPLGFHLSTFIPVPVIFRWLYQYNVPIGPMQTAFYEEFRPYFISTPMVFAILLAEAALCIILIARISRRQEIEGESVCLPS